MKAAALGQLSDIGFLFIDLKQNYSTLDKEMKKEIDWLEKAIKRVCTSRLKLENEIESLFPRLFSLRVKALDWIAQEGVSIEKVTDDLLPWVEKVYSNNQLKKLSLNIVSAIKCNKKFVQFLHSSGQLTDDKMKSVKDFDYNSFWLFLQYMPSQLRKIMSGLMESSLYIEFFSIAAVLINEKEFKPTPNKILQLTKLSGTVTSEYIRLINLLMNIAQQENFVSEQNDWMKFGAQSFTNMYSEDEPDISHLKLKEPNPQYNPN